MRPDEFNHHSMSILIIHNRYLLSGGEDEVVKSEENMLRRFGHKVAVYMRSNSEIQNFSLLKRIKTFLIDIYWSRESYAAVRKLIREKRPDIVHVHNTFFLVSPSIYDACNDEKVPIVQTLHNYRLLCPIGIFYRDGKICKDCLIKGLKSSVINKCWKGSRLATLFLTIIIKIIRLRIFFKKVKHYIVLGEFSRQMYTTNGVPSEKVSIKPNFLDFDPEISNCQGGYGLFIGTLQEYKGIKTLIKAWHNVKDHFPLKIIGEGPLRKELEESAQGKNIEFLGQKPLCDVMDYIKRSLFVIVPSECYETGVRVIIEAFAAGIPLIASNHGAMQELIVEHETGLFFTPKDDKGLSEKVNYLIDHKDIAKKMGFNARKEFEEKYTQEKNYQWLMNVYRLALKNANTAQLLFG